MPRPARKTAVRRTPRYKRRFSTREVMQGRITTNALCAAGVEKPIGYVYSADIAKSIIKALNSFYNGRTCP